MAMPMATATATAANSNWPIGNGDDRRVAAGKNVILFETISAERAFTVQHQGATTKEHKQTKLNEIDVHRLCVCGICK